MSSAYYKLWVWNGSSWTQITRFRALTFDRTVNIGGSISFNAPRLGAWGTLLTSGAENRFIRVTRQNSTNGTDGTVVDDFVIRVAEDEILNKEDLPVRGQTLEVLMKDLKLPHRVKFKDRKPYLIFFDTGTVVPTSTITGNTTGQMSIVGLKRTPVNATNKVATVNNTVSSTLTAEGKYDTTGECNTDVPEFRLENESLYSAVARLADQSKTYFRARFSSATSIAIDFYNRSSGGVVTRRAGGTGLETSNPHGGVDNARVLKMPSQCSSFKRVQDIERKAGRSFVVGGGDGTYQLVGTSGADSFKEVMYYAPEIKTQDAVNDLATKAQGIWDTATVGDRYVAVINITSLYSTTFDAELGDTVGVRDLEGTQFTGTFVKYVYRQQGETHDVFLSFTGQNPDALIARAVDTAIKEFRNTQGASNVTSPVGSGDCSTTKSLDIPFRVPENLKNISEAFVSISADFVKTTQAVQSTNFPSLGFIINDGDLNHLGSFDGDEVFEVGANIDLIVFASASIQSTDTLSFYLSVQPYTGGATQINGTVTGASAVAMPTSGYYTGHTSLISMASGPNTGSLTADGQDTVGSWAGAYVRNIFAGNRIGTGTVYAAAVIRNKEATAQKFRVLFTPKYYSMVTSIAQSGVSSDNVNVYLDGTLISSGVAVSSSTQARVTIPIGTSAGQLNPTTPGFHKITITPATASAIHLTAQIDLHMDYEK